MDDCANTCAPDRGAYERLSFYRCSRGFMLSVPNDYRASDHTPPRTYCFDHIEDLAAWLVEQYGPPEISLVAKAVRTTTKRTTRRRR